jgi:hypothetical protein
VLCGLAAACAGSSAGPSRTVVQEPEAPPIVTFTGTGASPTELHIYAQDVATFVNSDSRPHQVGADPRLNYDSRCSVIAVGLLNPGESRKEELQPSGIVCYYRDELDPTNAKLQGYVLVHY